MKVYVLPADAYACGHFRLVWPADVLRKSGHEIVIIPPSNSSGFLVKTERQPNGAEKIIGIQIPDDMDILVIQRPAHPLQPQMIQIIRSNGIPVIVDMDDDMSNIHPNNAAFHMYRHGSPTPFSHKYAVESCKWATMVTATTPPLLKTYAKHGRGRIINNYVPQAYLNIDHVDTGQFGWAGTLKSHPNDLQITRPAVQQLVDQGYPFMVTGDGIGVRGAAGLKEDPPATGTSNLENWARLLGASMDVGMVPLAPTAFNTAKSRLKGIEYMALGIPWVASPRAEYRQLQKESGTGFLADSPKQWVSYVKQLMDDDVLRKEQAQAGLDYMKSQTYELNAWRWWEAWMDAYDWEQERRWNMQSSR